MKTLPSSMMGSTDLVLWTLRIQNSFQDQIDHAMKDYAQVELKAKLLTKNNLSVREELLHIREIVDHLQKERPTEYIRKKEICLTWLSRWNDRINQWKDTVQKRIESFFNESTQVLDVTS